MTKRVAVISLTYYDEPRYLNEAALSLTETVYPRDHVAWVIVDNSCHGPSARYVREHIVPRSGRNLPEVIFVENDENVGFAKGNNQGIRWALDHGYDYVFLLNNDAKLAPTTISEAVRVAEVHPQAGAVQPMILLWNDPTRINTSGNDIHYLGFGITRNLGEFRTSYAYREGERIGYASGAGVLYRAKALRDVGLLEEFFWMYHEDLEMGWRLRLAGWESILAPSAEVFHDYEFRRSTKKMYWMERNRLLTHISHLSWRSLLLLAPALLFMEAVVFAGALSGGWGGQKVRSWLWMVDPCCWRYIRKTRKMIGQLRMQSDREVCALFVGRIKHQEVDRFFVRALLNPSLALYWIIAKRCL
ncbi:glycosyltransferase family 2 protein [Candidatus Uhrbacteria bacterium]|nr:glycosyltransferase family 2 protein [Candidatus Uhrbacteria bacterium]